MWPPLLFCVCVCAAATCDAVPLEHARHTSTATSPLRLTDSSLSSPSPLSPTRHQAPLLPTRQQPSGQSLPSWSADPLPPPPPSISLNTLQTHTHRPRLTTAGTMFHVPAGAHPLDFGALAFPGGFAQHGAGGHHHAPHAHPHMTMDITETGDEFRVSADLPGFKKEVRSSVGLGHRLGHGFGHISHPSTKHQHQRRTSPSRSTTTC